MSRKMRRPEFRTDESTNGPPDGDTVKEQARNYAALRKRERELESARKEAGGPLKDTMTELGLKKVNVPDFSEDESASVRIKERDNSKINPDRLKKAIGAKAFNKLTVPVLDEAKVEAAITIGDLDPNVVSQCMDEYTTEYLEARFNKRRRRG